MGDHITSTSEIAPNRAVTGHPPDALRPVLPATAAAIEADPITIPDPKPADYGGMIPILCRDDEDTLKQKD